MPLSLSLAGLDEYLEALDTGYDNCNFPSDVSRADFYAKCGAVAAEMGRRNAAGQ